MLIRSKIILLDWVVPSPTIARNEEAESRWPFCGNWNNKNKLQADQLAKRLLSGAKSNMVGIIKRRMA
uniref:Secreted protein n=1 Tax=Steinernema glaseri TaxID=37863 RepID=A0A1I8AWH7_9BILA